MEKRFYVRLYRKNFETGENEYLKFEVYADSKENAEKRAFWKDLDYGDYLVDDIQELDEFGFFI